jgi:hypothetical protein
MQWVWEPWPANDMAMWPIFARWVAVYVEAALPAVDQVEINRQQGGNPARSEAHLQELNDPPAGLLLGRIFAIGPIQSPTYEILRQSFLCRGVQPLIDRQVA